MKPLKGTLSISTWLLRILLIILVFLPNWEKFKTFNFTDLNYILLLIMAILVVLLFIGGFSRKHSLTVWSGLLIFILSIILVVLQIINHESFANMVPNLVFLTLGLFFASFGNK